ncbi:phage terminase large subunit family protein [Nitrospira sp. Nam74]
MAILSTRDCSPDIPLTVSQWADARRVLSSLSSAEPGQWHTDRAPYMREPMDAFSDPEVEEIVVRSSTQVGKTEFILNCLGYIIDYDPAPAMVVLPRDDDAKGWAAKRVRPMIDECPVLKNHTTGKEDDLAGKLYRFDRMMLKFAGANSPSDLASDPCRYVFFDEVDKYPKFSGREADPVKLGMERTRTFWNKKSVKVSTPTTQQGYITRDYERTDQRRFWLPCPHCGAFQALTFKQQEGGSGWLRFPEGVSSETIRLERLAWYECGHCRQRIDESAKPDMLARGVWCPAGCEVDRKGMLVGQFRTFGRRGYHLSALYSPWVSWSDIAAEFLDAKREAPLLMAFANSVLGEPWLEKVEETREDHLRRRLGVHALGEVPSGGVVLTAGVDVQKDHFWYVIRAWGVGEESWQVRYGRLESFEEVVHALLMTDYPSPSGAKVVRLICIDSGYRANEVYEFCRKYRERVRPIKGHDESLAAPYRVTTLDKDAAGRAIPGGLGLWTLDVDYYKTKLSRLIHTKPGDPGMFHLCEEVEQEYFDQMTAEHRLTQRNRTTGRTVTKWTPVQEGRANHYLDCEVYALAAAEMLKVYMLREPGEEREVFQPRPPSPWARRDARQEAMRGAWMKRS